MSIGGVLPSPNNANHSAMLDMTREGKGKPGGEGTEHIGHPLGS